MQPADASCVVEDEPVINDAVADRLRAEGFDVDQAYDGPARGRSGCAEVAPDVVVLDVMLPGLRRATRSAAGSRRAGRCRC